jgi:hypothetical protein
MSKYPTANKQRRISPVHPHHSRNATQSTPQLGSLTTILSPPFISAIAPSAKCATNIRKTRHHIHIDPNHKIHLHT